MMARSRGRFAFPSPVSETHGPWLGVQDGPAATEGGQQYAQMAQNYYIANPGMGGAWVPRPGWALLNPGHALGTPAARAPQGLGVYNRPASGAGGGPIVVAFVGGRMYQVNPFGNSGTVDVTPANVVLDPVATIYAVNYAGFYVFHDGVHPPYVWSGPGTGNAILLDWDESGIASHTVAAGPITVYYDQLFFVSAQTPLVPNANTLMWSEVNNPTLGYVQTVSGFTFADTWTLEQTGTDAITCILGTNNALYYWRTGSTGAIYGQVGSDFVTTGTHDAISSTTGTLSPRAVVLTDQAIYFLDQNGRPYYLTPGAGPPVPIWMPSLATFPTGGQASGCFDTLRKLVYWAVAGSPGANFAIPQIYVYDTRTQAYYGRWTHTSQATAPIGVFQITAFTDSGNAGTPSSAGVLHQDSGGGVYTMGGNGAPGGVGFDQTVVVGGALGSATIEAQLTVSDMAYDPMAETLFDRIQFVTLPFTARVASTVDYQLTRASAFSVAQLVQLPNGNTTRSEVDVGVNATARALRPRITNLPQLVAGLGAPSALSIVQCRVMGSRVDMNPGAP